MKSIELQAPKLRDKPKEMVSIFLAGSIEMGAAEQWQQTVIKRFPEGVLFYNPRRDDWDSTWDHNSDAFNEQVNWELNHLEDADIIVIYFDPATKSPITLLELGLFAHEEKPVYVYCPNGFWRQGNVRVVCERYFIPFFTDKETWLKSIELDLKTRL